MSMAVHVVRALNADCSANTVCRRLTSNIGVRVEYVERGDELLGGERPTLIVVEEAYVETIPRDVGRTVPLLLLLRDTEHSKGLPSPSRPLVTCLDLNPGTAVLHSVFNVICRHASIREDNRNLLRSLAESESELEGFSRIGMALESERDMQRLFELILTYARELTDADSGSMYVIHNRNNDINNKEKVLYFANTQSDTLNIPFQGMEMEISERSISGYVALHGQTLNIPDVNAISEDSPYHYNAEFDRRVGYRTRSMLTVPMRNFNNEIIGVLQLINKKKHRHVILDPIDLVEEEVLPFTGRDEQRALAFGGQAAVALENSILYQEIERLFEGFIRASVKAIESRDPVTSGHTERVTQYTLNLAKAVHEIQEGPYAEVTFTDKQMRELRYACLLHDVGKIGVREAVLSKAEKLYPGELAVIEQRFELIRMSVLLEALYAQLSLARSSLPEEFDRHVDAIDRQLKSNWSTIDRYWEIVVESNRPNIHPEDVSAQLRFLSGCTYRTAYGIEHPYLTDHEMRCLSIKKGSLTPEELEEIRSHVVHTRNFLERIPWSRDLLNVPEIASGHHEMMNGSGYPLGLNESELIIQTRMMAIADIFDALTAPDRPYKKGTTVEQALEILHREVESRRLDAELVRIFREKEVYIDVIQHAFADAV